MKYYQVKDGEWIQPRRKNYKDCCCSCGLVHDVDFRIHKGKIQFRSFINNRATAQVRRHLK